MNIASIPKIFVAVTLMILSAASFANDDFTSEKRQQLLAPVALYPDTVLTHILIASTYPLEIVQAERWLQSRKGLSAEEAVNAAENEPWDPSVKALLAFPDLLSRMSEDLLWTQELGEAFLADEKATLADVQQLRQRAWDNGSLAEMEHQKASLEDRQIIIQPTRREVVYVPYYDTRVVYGSWGWPAYPPVYWPRPPRYSGGFYWGFSAPVGDWFYFSGFHWGHRTVVISHSRPYYHYRHHHYGYHPRVEHWRHDPHHRRNVHYRHHGAIPQQRLNAFEQRGRVNSTQHREQVQRQLRHHQSRIDAVYGSNKQPRVERSPGTKQHSREAINRTEQLQRNTINRTPIERNNPRTQVIERNTNRLQSQPRPQSQPRMHSESRPKVNRQTAPSRSVDRSRYSNNAQRSGPGARGGRFD